MKKLVIFACLAVVMTIMNSCKPKQAEQVEEAYNESIQGTFFGVSFGAPKDEVIEKFAEHNWVLDNDLSTEIWLPFTSQKGERYSFGGMDWQYLHASLSNGKFYGIQFYNSHNDKAEAIERGESVLRNVSAKYKLVKEKPKDSTTYLLYRGKSKKEPKRQVVVYVERYESVGGDCLYSTGPQYCDREYDTVSDEL